MTWERADGDGTRLEVQRVAAVPEELSPRGKVLVRARGASVMVMVSPLRVMETSDPTLLEADADLLREAAADLRLAQTECPVCEKPFTADEWNARHSAADGADVHADCCGCVA